MDQREQIEQQIREILATENRAIPLSNKLFQPDGLFSQLAKTEAERRLVAHSPLFKQAQQRLTELQREEAADFSKAVQVAQSNLTQPGYVFKLEQTTRK